VKQFEFIAMLVQRGLHICEPLFLKLILFIILVAEAVRFVIWAITH
jgi:hypothetical protein